jgi:hypothetical protein
LSEATQAAAQAAAARDFSILTDSARATLVTLVLVPFESSPIPEQGFLREENLGGWWCVRVERMRDRIKFVLVDHR